MKSIFNRLKARKVRNYPTETHQLTETLQLDLWTGKFNGEEQVLWCISRTDPDSEEGRTYRRLTVEQLSECPLFLAKVCAAFSGIESLSDTERASLRELATGFAKLASEQSMNGEDEASEKKARVLQF